jgi:hypothetical protein
MSVPVGRFHKDERDEAFLRKLNGALAGPHDGEYRDLPESYPTLHVIGVPRSGTTLLVQLLASCLDVGYVNNLIAAFWRAPLYGIRLSRKLLAARCPSSFESDFGRTLGPGEPHEFGYFWRDLLGYGEPAQGQAERTDWERVRTVLVNMTHEFRAPVVFKSFLLGWHVREIQQVLPRTCFVWIRRDPVDNALSLLRLRRELLGDVEAWASLKPAEHAWLAERPVEEQVAGQVLFLERSFRRELDRALPRTTLELGYDRLCADPHHVLEDVRALCAEHGVDAARVHHPPRSFVTRSPEGPEIREQRVRVAAAMERLREEMVDEPVSAEAK